MSHFTVLVTKTQEKPVDEQLAPFDEEREVPTYDTECWCLNSVAHHYGRTKAKEELGWDIDDKRTEYWKLPAAERADEKWQSMTKPFVELSEKLEKEHELYGKFDPSCERCHGTGTYATQFNPDSKWDWFAIGGRWMGFFKLKPGAKGKLGKPGIGGNKPKHHADIAKVKDIDWQGMGQSVYTFAVLHVGTWHEQGYMGWFGMASNEKSDDEWQAEFDRIVQSLDPEDEVTLVDCHI